MCQLIYMEASCTIELVRIYLFLPRIQYPANRFSQRQGAALSLSNHQLLSCSLLFVNTAAEGDREKGETISEFALRKCRILNSLPTPSPGFRDAIPAFILIGAPCCQFAAYSHWELDPVLSHLPQLAGQICHLSTQITCLYFTFIESQQIGRKHE